ncbi:MAG: PDZ domain-containing protein [Myxococcota bacterium]|jgi:S1-C subfamily serine protease|nr:PDZ domain-containing protein [Myxococcota bacterium]
MTTAHKFLLSTAIVFALVISGAAWFFFVFLPGHAGTPEVLADIDSHFKTLEARAGGLSAETPLQSGAPGTAPKKKKNGKKAAGSRFSLPTKGVAAAPHVATGIRQLDAVSYLIPSSLFEAAADNPKVAFAGTTAKRTPLADGKSRFSVQGIGPRSLLHEAGLRSGDELLQINGYPIDSPDSVVTAYAALRASKSYRLDVLRNGKALSLYYKIE